MNNNFFEMPQLSPDTKVFEEGPYILLESDHENVTIPIDDDQKEIIIHFLNFLSLGDRSLKEILSFFPENEDTLNNFFKQLDEFGFIQENEKIVNSEIKYFTGDEFFTILKSHVKNKILKYCQSSIFNKMNKNELSSSQFLGYIKEHFHIVNQCPRIIAPILIKEDCHSSRKLLEEFYSSELNHDHFLIKTLINHGLKKDEVLRLNPLPMTQGICSTLFHFALNHPLSFKAVLFILEDPNEDFYRKVGEYSQFLGFPKNACAPLIKHTEINNGENHQDISFELFKNIDLITIDDAEIVKRNISIFISMLAAKEKQILDFYSKNKNLLARVF